MTVKEPISEFLDYLYPNKSEMILGDTLNQLKQFENENHNQSLTGTYIPALTYLL